VHIRKGSERNRQHPPDGADKPNLLESERNSLVTMSFYEYIRFANFAMGQVAFTNVKFKSALGNIN